MKIAEALQHRADLINKLNKLSDLLNSSVCYQEGTEPPEDMNALIAEYESMSDELKKLVYDINMVNNTTYIDDYNITYYIAKRDCLRAKIRMYNNLIQHASNIGFRITGREIKTLSAINVKDIRKKVDELSKELRITDNLLQSTNWTAEMNV